MYKTILTILKKMFTRDLALQFTVIRQSKNKYVIKETTFYKTLFGEFIICICYLYINILNNTFSYNNNLNLHCRLGL